MLRTSSADQDVLSLAFGFNRFAMLSKPLFMFFSSCDQTRWYKIERDADVTECGNIPISGFVFAYATPSYRLGIRVSKKYTTKTSRNRPSARLQTLGDLAWISDGFLRSG